MMHKLVFSLGLLGVLSLGSASARDRGHVDIRIGEPTYVQPAPVIVQQGGHYETRYQTVMVAPERCERQYVPPVTETRRDIYGRHYTLLVRDGYWTEVRCPARYEQRAVQVWVPDAVVYTAPPPPPRRGIFDVFFKF